MKEQLESDAYYLNSQEEQLKLKVKKQEGMIAELRSQLKNNEFNNDSKGSVHNAESQF